MKVNFILIAVAVVAILAFLYVVIKKNYKDQKELEKELEKELNQKDIKPEKHEGPRI